MSVNVERFLDSKGQFIAATWVSPKKPAAAHKAKRLEKRTSGTFRAGITFAKLGSVKDGIRDGERGEVGPLPWGEWNSFPTSSSTRVSDTFVSIRLQRRLK